MIHPPKGDGPHVLIYDIEISPTLGWVWGLYDQNVIKVHQDWYMLSFAYKWLGQKRTHFVGLNQDKKFEPHSTDDRYVVERLHRLFDVAHILVHHNGNRFDMKKANSRFLLNNLDPPSHYQTIDPLTVHRKHFGHLSNKLDDLGEMYGLGTKEKHDGFATWLGCMAGEKRAWKLMERYNKQDVSLLEKVYLKVRPWMVVHPNMGHWQEGERICPKCGKDTLVRNGVRRTLTMMYREMKCTSCGGYSRARFAEESDIEYK